jgi:hypothetical protein
MNEDQGKRMVAGTGYEVMQSVHIGDKEIVLAENMNEPEELYYFLGNYRSNGSLGEYSQCLYGSDYLSIVQEFTARINGQIESLRNEFKASDYQAEPITADQCFPNDYNKSIEGEVVVIKASVLRPEYRRGDMQLVYVTGGNGARANPRGNAVLCFHLSDGKHTRFERNEVQGIIKVIPKWAMERLAIIQAGREPKKAGTKAEMVGHYTITSRIQVGNHVFVLGENPDAPSPYATWQQTPGRTGYDWGHYFSDFGKAQANLQSRADRERENQSSGKGTRHKNRDDAR